MKKQSGFTLIELVVVMVILGILAAVALPKFVDMSSQARKASLAGAYGAVNSAMAITHAAALAQNKTGPTDTVSAEGQTINMVYGYPAASITTVAATQGIIFAAGISATDYVLAGGPPVTIQVSGATTPTSCQVTYTAATSTAAATVSKVDSGC